LRWSPSITENFLSELTKELDYRDRIIEPIIMLGEYRTATGMNCRHPPILLHGRIREEEEELLTIRTEDHKETGTTVPRTNTSWA
jgi:hypothetical protein